MKEYIALIAGLLLTILCFTFQPILGIIIWVGLAAITSTAIDIYNRYQEDKHLNGLIDDLYILTSNPDTGEEPEITRQKGKYIVVKHSEVFDKIEEYRKKLEKVKNPFYLGIDENGDPLPEEEQIDVKPIIYKHGRHVDEYWTEYLQRAEEKMTNERAEKHGHHASNAYEWYIGAHHRQNDNHLRKKVHNR